MKRIIFPFLLLGVAVPQLHAQDSFTNYQMVNTTDVFGSARYTAMGGAMGALGTDISAISNNPAAIGLFRKNDFSISMGGQIQDQRPYSGDSRGRFSFDQVGFVACFPSEDGSSFFNMGLNFQKKNHFGNSFFVEGGLNGLSQSEQFHGLYNDFYSSNPDAPEGSLNMVANKSGIFNNGPRPDSYAAGFDYNRLTTGNLYGLDLNFSGNLQNRIYLGATVGLDFVNYKTSQRYVEYRDGVDALAGTIQDYDLMSNRRVTGQGLNIKLGAIFRPIEDDPFRIGIAVETPTWYTLTQEDSYFSIASKWDMVYDQQQDAYVYNYLDTQGDYAIYDSPDDNYLDFNVFTPWKFRVQAGSTVSNYLAWDVEYEYAMYDYTKMGYPDSYDVDGPSINMDKDRAMGQLTHDNISGVHNLRAGVEIKPTSNFAARIGYNYWSRPMKKNATFDQTINSYAMDYTLGTEWMNLGETNMLTFGIGFRAKGGFYADLAYKYRAQSADFYAFDASYQGARLQPQKVNLDRHGFNVTLGYRF